MKEDVLREISEAMARSLAQAYPRVGPRLPGPFWISIAVYIGAMAAAIAAVTMLAC